MANVPLEQLLDKANNSIYKLVILASRRSLEIAEGMPRFIQDASTNSAIKKPTTIALEEIAVGKVHLKKEKEKKSK